jgi:hypothetical protein
MAMTISGTSGITFPTGTAAANILGNSTQTYQNLTASRVNGTTYTNSTGAPILLVISAGDAAAQPLSLTILINGNATPITSRGAPTGTVIAWSLVIPIGQTYSATWNASANFSGWWELR